MRQGRKQRKVKWDEIQLIIEKYNTTRELKISDTFQDGGLGLLFPRLGRAALNQIEPGGDAIFSRYGIWANTARDTIIESIKLLEQGERIREALPLLIEVANSLSAFSDIQALFDPIFHDRRTE